MKKQPTVDDLILLLAERCFNGALPGRPEEIGLAIVQKCLPNEPIDKLTVFMQAVVPAIERRQRLTELDSEISKLRGMIGRYLADAELVQRIYPDGAEREVELFQLQAEKEWNESALPALEKEREELQDRTDA